jgi:hypothetical protein
LDEAEGIRSQIRTPLQAVVRTQAAWRALWARHAGSARTARPQVDFARHTIVAVFGGRTTDGARIRIRRIVRRGEQVIVVIGALAGPRGPDVASFHIVRIPRTDRPVVFAVEGAPEPLEPPVTPLGP